MDTAILAFASSATLGALLLLTSRFHDRYSADPVGRSAQKVHAVPVPRIGGLAIYFGFAAGAVSLWGDAHTLSLALALLALPAFFGGLVEDLNKHISTVARLLWTFAAAGFAFFALDARITDLSLPGTDLLLGMAFASLLFTMFAVAGCSHSLNIVDGLNGLAGITALAILTAIAFVARAVGDDPIAVAALVAAGSVAGFLVWNFPRGALFLGDGGSYLVGFVVAELAVLLVHRNTEVSPWFALTVLAYPVCETVFSMYRRRMLLRRSAMDPDGLHLHTLVYKRLTRHNGRGSANENAAATVYLVMLGAMVMVPAVYFWNNTLALQAVALTFVGLYLVCYRTLVRMRVPWWLSLRGLSRRAEMSKIASADRDAISLGKRKPK